MSAIPQLEERASATANSQLFKEILLCSISAYPQLHFFQQTATLRLQLFTEMLLRICIFAYLQIKYFFRSPQIFRNVAQQLHIRILATDCRVLTKKLRTFKTELLQLSAGFGLDLLGSK
jgi:hypothetical protein